MHKPFVHVRPRTDREGMCTAFNRSRNKATCGSKNRPSSCERGDKQSLWPATQRRHDIDGDVTTHAGVKRLMYERKLAGKHTYYYTRPIYDEVTAQHDMLYVYNMLCACGPAPSQSVNCGQFTRRRIRRLSVCDDISFERGAQHAPSS